MFLVVDVINGSSSAATPRRRASRAQLDEFCGPIPACSKLWLEIRDHSNLPNHNASHVVPTLMPRRLYRWEAHTICTRRGEYTLGPMTIAAAIRQVVHFAPDRTASASSCLPTS
jgi:hypothetical protein